jgi:site-specific DNA-methyltransferase (adenine-specific)
VIYHGEALETLRGLADDFVDAVVTDPPYELGFMGRAWDASGIAYSVDLWRECLRVLKPGGHLLAFGGTRTSHRLTCAIEDAGFEIRDSIAWLYGSGFPKSLDVSKAIDKQRDDRVDVLRVTSWLADRADRVGVTRADVDTHMSTSDMGGWWLSRLAHRCALPTELDEQSGTLTSGANPTRRGSDKFRDAYGEFAGQPECAPARGADSGGASRFFLVFRYQAKAPTRKRPKVDGVAHPCVKPLELMRWLVRLATQPDGVVLDPFAGSGTTVEACALEGMRCIGIEQSADYLPLIDARLTRAGLVAL